MNIISIFSNRKTVFIAVIVVLFGILYRDKFDSFYKSLVQVVVTPKHIPGVLSQEDLAKFNGVDNDKLYVVVIGSIFDVSEGRKHYQKGSSYNYFVGKDGSRAFVTGQFSDESPNKDQVLDLSCDDLLGLVSWKTTFTRKYKPVGVHVGRYYDANGQETQYMKELNNKLDQCQLDREQKKEEDIKFPPCNISWDQETGSKVWCTKSSGGIHRSWVGVPRQLFTPGLSKPRCVCINQDMDYSSALLKLYDNCAPSSTTCFIENDS